MEIVEDSKVIRYLIEKETKRTGGIFRLAPTWVGRPGMVQPGCRIKLQDRYISNEIVVNERWLSSVTYSDNGKYNDICPADHGYSYIVIEGRKVRLDKAMDICHDILLGSKEKWDVLPKFFDNRNRLPFHLHPCQHHVREGLIGKPESYHFPVELNQNQNNMPFTFVGVSKGIDNAEILDHLRGFGKGDNHLTDIGYALNIAPGSGYYMPACTLHAPGSLVTYELQVASDVSCIPESRVNEREMPEDLLDRDLPVSVKKDGVDKVAAYIMDMINCKDSGNRDDFRSEYYRPPVTVLDSEDGRQDFIIYRCGRRSEPINPDLYSAKHTTVYAGRKLNIRQKAPFGTIVLRGSGTLSSDGREMVPIQSVTMFESREDCFFDEYFVSAYAANNGVEIAASDGEPLSIYQHFSSDSNPEAAIL